MAETSSWHTIICSHHCNIFSVSSNEPLFSVHRMTKQMWPAVTWDNSEIQYICPSLKSNIMTAIILMDFHHIFSVCNIQIVNLSSKHFWRTSRKYFNWVSIPRPAFELPRWTLYEHCHHTIPNTHRQTSYSCLTLNLCTATQKITSHTVSARLLLDMPSLCLNLHRKGLSKSANR